MSSVKMAMFEPNGGVAAWKPAAVTVDMATSDAQLYAFQSHIFLL